MWRISLTGIEQIELILKSNKFNYQKEYRFHPVRKWRFDFLIGNKIAIEYEGGAYGNSRHRFSSGFIKDCEKYNQAQLLGYKVLRYTVDIFKNPQQIIDDVRALDEL